MIGRRCVGQDGSLIVMKFEARKAWTSVSGVAVKSSCS